MILFLCIFLDTSYAQENQPPSLNIGDLAPQLRVREWIKGTPVQRFESGHVYVLEFWATWCGPCIEAMPHLSRLARKYKNHVTIIGIDTREKKTTSIQKVKAFVDSMGRKMDIYVAAEDSSFMHAGWIEAVGERAIPVTFVLNAAGRLAWIGHPSELDKVLPAIVNNIWDIKVALADRNLKIRLQKEDRAASEILNNYAGKYYGDFYGDPDSALIVINEIISKEPKLKFAPAIAYHTMLALLKTNLHEGYEYGKIAIVTSTYEDPACNSIIRAIDATSDRFAPPAEIYRLGADAYQQLVNLYPQNMKTAKTYLKMAEWYLRGKDKLKAKQSMRQALKMTKCKKDYWSGFINTPSVQ
jgi:thiol-disulfide isomerase/thioredoxin